MLNNFLPSSRTLGKTLLSGKGPFMIMLFAILASPLTVKCQQAADCDVSGYTLQWVANTDFYENLGSHLKNKHLIANYDPSKMKPQLEVALKWIQRMSEGVTGAKTTTYNNHFIRGNPDPEALATDVLYPITGQLGHYYLHVSSKYLTCLPDGKKSQLPGPAWIDISFNRFKHFAKQVTKSNETGITLPYLIEGSPVFMLPELKRSENNVDYYEYPGEVPDYVVNYAKWHFLHVFIIRKSGVPLFIPVTRRQYLEQYLKDMEVFYKHMKKLIAETTNVYPPESFDKELADRIAEIKKLTEQGAWGYSKENMEDRIQRAKEHYRRLKEEEANKVGRELAKADADYAESIRIIRDYLSQQPDSVLNRPLRQISPNALFDPHAVKIMIENFDDRPNERMWGRNIIACYLNPAYFNKALPPDVPQFIAVEMVNLENLHKHLNQIAANINKAYDFEALKALLK